MLSSDIKVSGWFLEEDETHTGQQARYERPAAPARSTVPRRTGTTFQVTLQLVRWYCICVTG
jgi:hypothetical protein